MGRKAKKCYLFDNGGVLVKPYDSVEDLAIVLKTTVGTIRSSIQRKSCLQLKFYVSYDADFNVNAISKKKNFNPVLSKQLNSFNSGGNKIHYFDNVDEFNDDEF